MAKTKTTPKKKVLFFDNEAYIVNFLTQSLNELFNWDVKFVPDIDELFHELSQEEKHYDVLILDVMAPMPESSGKYVNFEEQEIGRMKDGLMTGVVIARKIWKLENYKTIPILFLSAKRNPIPDNEDLKSRKCDYLRKPQFAKDVDDKLHELLGLK